MKQDEAGTSTADRQYHLKVLLSTDLRSLTPEERQRYLLEVCEAAGLNPVTKPLDYHEFDGKVVLYAKRDAADQLAKIHAISTEIVDARFFDEDKTLYGVRVRATGQGGRATERTGYVATKGRRYNKETKQYTEYRLQGQELGNALMKCETKGCRRAILAWAGLGVLDETEITDMVPADPEKPEVIDSAGARGLADQLRRQNERAASAPTGTTPSAEAMRKEPEAEPAQPVRKDPEAQPTAKAAAKPAGKPGEKIDKAAQVRLWAAARTAGGPLAQQVVAALLKRHGLTSTADITTDRYQAMLADIDMVAKTVEQAAGDAAGSAA